MCKHSREKTHSSLAQSVEHSAVNRVVVGSSPTGGATKRQVYDLSQTVDKPHSCKGLNGVLFERIVIFPNCDEKMCKYGIFVGIMVIL